MPLASATRASLASSSLFNFASLPRQSWPFRDSSRDPLQEGTPNGVQVGTPACDHEHRNAQCILKLVEIDHVETGNGDPL